MLMNSQDYEQKRVIFLVASHAFKFNHHHKFYFIKKAER
ncbi:hypothetical protein SMU85_09343 [Streptococcus mutans ST6]|nr:hypothetical protein SMU85_09343 [Streptococcus mutans ST6]